LTFKLFTSSVFTLNSIFSNISDISEPLGVNFVFVKFNENQDIPNSLSSVFEPLRSALIADSISGVVIGVVGEYKKSGQDIFNSYKIINSISPDLQYYRQTLTPSLLNLIHPNIKQGFDEFALYEIGKTHSKNNGLNEESVPIESEMSAFVYASKNTKPGAPYYRAKSQLDYLGKSLGVNFVFVKFNENQDIPNSLSSVFEPLRSALIADSISGVVIGVVGEYKKSVIKNFKLPDYVAGFEFDTNKLFSICPKLVSNYSQISKYPSTERDICFQVSDNVVYSEIIKSAKDALENVVYESLISPVDIYKIENSDTKKITIRVKLTAYDHTLKNNEIAEVISAIINSVQLKTDARAV